MLSNRKYLELALKEAYKASKTSNYPIGSLLVTEKGRIVAKCQNENSTTDDVSAHAEIQCLRKAGIRRLSKGSGKLTLFTSEEPCFGCSFFLARTNIKKVVWALTDPYKGGIGDLKRIPAFRSFFKGIRLVEEPFKDLRDRSRLLMKDYFLAKGNIKAMRSYKQA